MNELNVDIDKKNTVIVDSKDLLRSEKVHYKQWLKISPFVIRVEIQLGEVQGASLAVNKRLRDDVIKGATKAAEDIQDDIAKELKALGKDLKKLVKDDELGVKEAAENAQKKVEAAHKKIAGFLPDFGKQVRKAVEKEIGKLPSAVRSHSTGSFKDIDLVYEFKGGAESYTSYHGKLTDVVTSFQKNMEDAGKLEGKGRQRFETALKAWHRGLETEPNTTMGREFSQSAQGRTLFRELETSSSKYQSSFAAWQDAISSGKRQLDPKELRKDSEIAAPLEKSVASAESLEKVVKAGGKSLDDIARLLDRRPTWGELAKSLPGETERTSEYRKLSVDLAAVTKALTELKRAK